MKPKKIIILTLVVIFVVAFNITIAAEKDIKIRESEIVTPLDSVDNTIYKDESAANLVVWIINP